MIVSEVIGFARRYINEPSYRTQDRKEKIRQAYKSLTGEKVRNCGTCYIEALFKIINITKMARTKYQLRPGVVLQAFGDPTKTCTNANLTDELAQWYLTNKPETRRLFAIVPDTPIRLKPEPPPDLTIVEPKTAIEEAVGMMAEAQEEVKPKPKTTRKTKK